MYGVEYSAFAALTHKIESLGVSVEEVADKVLEEVAPAAVAAYKLHVPYDRAEKDSIHARDNVSASRTKSGYRGRYKLVGAFIEGKDGKLNWNVTLHSKKGNKEVPYLFYVENGTSKMLPRPFMKAAEEAVKAAVAPKIKAAVEAEIKSRLG